MAVQELLSLDEWAMHELGEVCTVPAAPADGAGAPAWLQTDALPVAAASSKQRGAAERPQVREHSSAVERCGPHIAISPAMLRSFNVLAAERPQERDQLQEEKQPALLKGRCVFGVIFPPELATAHGFYPYHYPKSSCYCFEYIYKRSSCSEDPCCEFLK